MIAVNLNKNQPFSILLLHYPQYMASNSWSKKAVEAPAIMPVLHSGGRGKEGEQYSSFL